MIVNHRSAHSTTERPTRRAQSLVEFALILPLLLLVIFGVLDLGRAFFATIAITNASREGARFMTLNPDDIPGGIAAAVTEADGLIGSEDVIVECESKCPRFLPVKVTVEYDLDLILSFILPSSVQTVHISRSTEMFVP